MPASDIWIFRAGDGEDAATGSHKLVSCTGSSDDPVCRTPSDIAFLVFARARRHARSLFAHAANLGIEALAVADRNSLAGIVRAHEAAKVTGVRLIAGCRLDLADGLSVLVYPTDRPAYSRLCRLLSVGKKRGGKGKCILTWEDVADWSEGLIAVLVSDSADDTCALRIRRLRAKTFGDRAYMALTLRRRPNDQMRIHELNNLAQRIPARDRRYQRRAVSRARRDASCRTSSPASGTMSPSTRPASAVSGMPTDISSRRRRWHGCSRAIRKRWRARWRSPPAAPSAWTNWPTSIRKSGPCRV